MESPVHTFCNKRLLFFFILVEPKVHTLYNNVLKVCSSFICLGCIDLSRGYVQGGIRPGCKGPGCKCPGGKCSGGGV